jgi:hypothetical protein
MTAPDVLTLLKITLLSRDPGEVKAARGKLADMMLDVGEVEAEAMLRDGVTTAVVFGSAGVVCDADDFAAAVARHLFEYTSYSRVEKDNLDEALAASDGWHETRVYDTTEDAEAAIRELREEGEDDEAPEEDPEEPEEDLSGEGLFRCNGCRANCSLDDRCRGCAYCTACCVCV